MSDWRPPRCEHGHIILGCPHADCVAQGAYLDQMDAAMREFHRHQRLALGPEPFQVGWDESD